MFLMLPVLLACIRASRTKQVRSMLMRIVFSVEEEDCVMQMPQVIRSRGTLRWIEQQLGW